MTDVQRAATGFVWDILDAIERSPNTVRAQDLGRFRVLASTVKRHLAALIGFYDNAHVPT